MTQSLEISILPVAFLQFKAEQDGFHATGSIVVDDGTITVNSGDDGSMRSSTPSFVAERSLLKKATKAWKENASWSTAVTLP